MIYGLEEAIANDVATAGIMVDMDDVLPVYLRPYRADSVKRFLPKLLPGDFVMLTEFTNDKGPVALTDYIIPSREDVEVNGFNLDDFATKIMSADYFAHANTHDQEFRMPEDMHALISNSEMGCYTLLYAFTLYDIDGRGYVRPAYLSYTSQERRKLVTIYEELTTTISKAVEHVMHSNIRMFARDLRTYISTRRDLNVSSAMSAEEAGRLAYIEEVFQCVAKQLEFDMSEFIGLPERTSTGLRDISEISHGWSKFQTELQTLHKRYSHPYSQMSRPVTVQRIASTETHNLLRIGDSPVAPLLINEDFKRKLSKRDGDHHGSTGSVGSSTSCSTLPSTNSAQTSLSSSPTSEPVSFASASSGHGRTGSIASNGSWGFIGCEPGSESQRDELDASQLYNESQSTLKPELDSLSTDSLPSRFGMEATLTPKSLPLQMWTPETYPGLTTLITEHKLHVRDLIYSVLISQPVVLLSTDETKASSAADALSAFVPGSTEHKSSLVSYIFSKDFVTFKSVLRHPITVVVTSEKLDKVTDSLRLYSTVYDLHSRSYTGPTYQHNNEKLKVKGLLDLFYRDKKHKHVYFFSLVQSLIMELGCKAKLLHTILQHKTRIDQTNLQSSLGLPHSGDFNIVKNLVHTVVKQQHVNKQGVNQEDISSICLTLTLT